MKSDIKNRSDIQILIDAFYEKVKVDPIIGFIFHDVANIDWVAHLPVMYNFWEMVLFGSGPYRGDPMTKHILLGKKTALLRVHFDRWISLFNQTVDERFSGDKAAEAKSRAQSIADLMHYRIHEKGS